MTDMILMCLGAGGAGFILGALLVHWAYRPVRYEKAPHEWDFTRSQDGISEYKAGDVALVSVPGGKTEHLTITHIHVCDDLVGRYLMSGDQFIPVDWIVGGYRP